MQHWACWWKNNLLSIGLYGSISAHTGKREEKRKTCQATINHKSPQITTQRNNQPIITPENLPCYQGLNLRLRSRSDWNFFLPDTLDPSALQAFFVAIVALCYAPSYAPFRCLISLKLKAFTAPIYAGFLVAYATTYRGLTK